jgi:Ca2+-binding EF-hand superfamily protein
LTRTAPIASFALLLAASALVAAAPPAKKPAPVLHKGDVTRAQMRAQVKQVFDMADTNHDGFMSRQEFAVRMGGVVNNAPAGATKAQAQKMLDAANAAFNAVDANHDGKLSLAEANRRPLAAFDQMDTNHDGVLSVQEKIAAHTAGHAGAGPAAEGPGIGSQQGPGR